MTVETTAYEGAATRCQGDLLKSTYNAHFGMQEEAKPHRGFLRWTRRSGRRSSDASKATIDMEPVIQTEKDARRLSGARRNSSHAQPGATTSSKEQQENAQPSQESMQSPDVELSTFVTADEYAREGKELQSLRSARQDSEARLSLDPLLSLLCLK